MEYIQWLNSPHLVCKFQKIFGIEKISEDSSVINNKKIEDNTKKSSFVDNILLKDGTVGGGDLSVEEKNLSINKKQNYVIKNSFWYYLFLIATKAGDEMFYSLFFTFWIWNVDGAVLRKMNTIFMITMYFGQALKDLLMIPRPASPPVIRLDSKWVLEYGLPSTHAAVGLCIPLSLMLFSYSRYQLPWYPCLIVVVAWCILVSFSRIYLGMHSVLDVICGIILAMVVMAVIVPHMDSIDYLVINHPLSPLIIIAIAVTLLLCYPNTDDWNPARGDTAVVVGVGSAILIGSWINYQTGMISPASISQPYAILWPSISMIGLSILRTIVGLVMLLASRIIAKTVSFKTACALVKITPEDYNTNSPIVARRQRVFVENFYKFCTYHFIGFTFTTLAPAVFKITKIERPTFYTEV